MCFCTPSEITAGNFPVHRANPLMKKAKNRIRDTHACMVWPGDHICHTLGATLRGGPSPATCCCGPQFFWENGTNFWNPETMSTD